MYAMSYRADAPGDRVPLLTQAPRPGDDIRELRAQLAAGDHDFAGFEMAS